MDFVRGTSAALAIAAAITCLAGADRSFAQTPTTIATYTYNAKGERITKTVGGSTTTYSYDERGHLINEHGPNGDRDYVYVGDILVSTVDTPAGSTAPPSTVSYVTADDTGTPRAVTTSSGNVIWQNPYQGNAWGEQPASSSGYSLNVRSFGQYYDAETGLIYNGQRYVDPTSGRFTQPDPLGLAGGINPYVDVSNSPLNRVDPDGLRDIFVGGFGDSRSAIVKSYYDNYHQNNPDSAYYSWTNLKDILQDIANAKPGDPINLIGHSYGGDTAAKAAMLSCKKVNLLITIDPVSRFRPDLNALAGKVGTWVDVDAEGNSIFQPSNFIAAIGGKWDGAANGIADSYIQDNGVNHEDFQQMMNASGPGMNSPAQILSGAPIANPPFVQAH